MNMQEFIESLDDKQKEDLKKLLGSGPAVSDEDSEDSEDTTRVDKEFKVNRKIKDTKRRTTVKGGKNKWVDTGEFKDITTPDVERTPRRRSAPKKEPVECHVCGKSFKADPRYLYGEYYRCNQCTGR